MLCSLVLLMNSSKITAMDDGGYVITQRVEVLIGPWANRKELALQYMHDAKELNSIKEIEEVSDGVKIKTSFDPEIDVVGIQIGRTHGVWSYETFIGFIDSLQKEEPMHESTSALAPQPSTWRCSLQ